MKIQDPSVCTSRGLQLNTGTYVCDGGFGRYLVYNPTTTPNNPVPCISYTGCTGFSDFPAPRIAISNAEMAYNQCLVCKS